MMKMEHKVYTPNEADLAFQLPEFLYKIILVCMFFGFILFLIFFALARYLKYQNRCRALLIAQQERETGQFPPGLDGLLLGSDGEMPIVIQAQREDPLQECKSDHDRGGGGDGGGGGEEDTCQPLNPNIIYPTPPLKL